MTASPARNAVLAIQALYVVAVGTIMTFTVGTPGITSVFLLVAIIGLWSSKRMLGLVADLAPFFFLIVCYEDLRGFADNISPFQVHVSELVRAERFLFGGILPAAWLQAHISSRVVVWASMFFYGMHFVYPVILGVLLWVKLRSEYWRYMLGLMVMTYTGFLCYLLYPAAPPWWASHFGFISEPIQVIGIPVEIMLQSPNPVAAFPSLHGGYAAYVAIFAIYTWRRPALWTLLIPAGVTFACIMLGHHYLVDLLAGYVLAAGAFLLSQAPRFHRLAAATGSLFWSAPPIQPEPCREGPRDSLAHGSDVIGQRLPHRVRSLPCR